MNRNATSPSYLVRTPFAYCFRMVVPKDIQPLVGKTELRYSLRTGSLQAAKQKARLLAGHVQLYFQRVRQQGMLMSALTDTQIESLVADYIQFSVPTWNSPLRPEDYDFERNGPPPYQTAEELQDYIATLEAVREDLVVEMNLGQCHVLEDSVVKLLKRNGINDVNPGSPDFQRLCYFIIKAEIQLLPLQQRYMQGDFSYQNELSQILPTIFLHKLPAMIPAPAPAQPQGTLSYVAEKYWLEKKSNWKPRTIDEYRIFQEKLLKFFGKATPIATIDYKRAGEYKEFILSKTVPKEIGLSPSRINNYLKFANGLFHFALRNNMVKINPFSGLQISEKGRRADEMRDVFDSDDLTKLFVTSKEYSQDTHYAPNKFWVPLLGLYTGCRLEEICQLYVEDIKQVDGINVLDINQDKPDKSVKTNERRMVPLHPFLVDDLRFVDFVKSLPDQEGRVFPELKHKKNRYGQNVSQWFRRFRNRCGVKIRKGKKDYHSLRHTVINHLVQKNVAESYIARFVGHKLKSIDTGRYGKAYPPKQLLEETVLKLDYGIDLSHLKNSKYVPK